MSTFVFVTHTAWSEVPRIRHQLARLISAEGHEVVYFERPGYPWAPTGDAISHPERGITVVSSQKLIHHQLRVIPALDWINTAFVKHQFRTRLKLLNLDPEATVINFAQDYYFLRDLFPKSRRIVTIIHDDWEAQARFPRFGHVTRNMRRTCCMSHDVFAVSTPLVKRIREWCYASLLPPWSVRKYQKPHADTARRNVLLFWGFIDRRIDIPLMHVMSKALQDSHPHWKILLVGPTQVEADRVDISRQLQGLTNVSILPPCDLDGLPLDEVIAALIPYADTMGTSAVELSNKALHLFSRGVPILASGMPNFVREPFALQVTNRESFDRGVRACVEHFNDWQPAIQAFVENNSASARLRALGITTAR